MDDMPLSRKEEAIPISEHTLKINRVCNMYQTHLSTGLTEIPKVALEKGHKGVDEAAEHEAAFVDDLRLIFGYNEVRERDNVWIRMQELCSRTFDTFTLLLLFGSFMCFIGWWSQKSDGDTSTASVDTLHLGIVLITVVFFSTVFTIYQIDKSRRIIRDFKNNIQPKALVMRDGKFAVVLARELLPGDIVSVKKGDRVPADIRVYKTVSLKVDQSILTGDSEPVTKNTKICDPDHWDITTAPNIILQRSYVVEGMCMGIVIRTGKNTLAELEQAEETKIEKGTPIQREIQNFKEDITILAFGLGILCAIIALSYGYTFIEACIFMLGLIVANVPEAMLATLSVSMAMVAKRMSRKGCFVINLQAVETVGAVSVIVAHKTSFLTMKNLQPLRVHTSGSESIVKLDLRDENLYERLESYKEIRGMREFGLGLALSSSAWFVPTEDDVPMMERTVVGDSTESGILRLCALMQGDDTLELKERNKKVAELLNSLPGNREAQKAIAVNKKERQLYVDISIHQRSVNKSYFVIIKGVPRSVFTFCDHYLNAKGGREEFSDEYREILEDEIDALSYQGEKVVALCQRNLSSKKFPDGYKFNMVEPNFPLTGYRYIGFLSLLETEKPGIHEDIEACRKAGIRLVMATIDDPILAEAMAKRVGLIQESTMRESIMNDIDDEDEEYPHELHRIVMGQEVENMSFEQLTKIIETYQQLAFARISPDQRVKMVAALQSCGYIVAVVGGNVYDKDALLKADVGISLENEGNDLAKDNADLILVDNSLSSLLNCIEEGRLMFDNLKKFIVFTLSLNIPEVMPFLAFVTLGIPLPLGSITILFIDVVSDLVPGVSLAYEKSEQNIMSRKPRVLGEQLVNARLIYMSYGLVGFVQGIAGFFMYSVIMAEHGFLFSSLFGIRSDWENPRINDLKDSYKQEWSYPQRKSLEYLCHTGYFLAMVQVQWADLIISKTRYVSLFQQGMSSNYHLNFALFFETLVTIVLIYTPGTPEALRLYALSPTYWIPVIPYAFLIWIFDEWRRYLIRKYPDGFLVTLTDY